MSGYAFLYTSYSFLSYFIPSYDSWHLALFWMLIFATSATKAIDNVVYDRKAPLDKHNRLSPYK